MTVDFFASTPGIPYNQAALGLVTSPINTMFYKQDSWGYSLNGKEFLVAEGGSYTTVKDSFKGTHAAILGGVNGGAKTDFALRKLTKAVNTGWAVAHPQNAASNVLTLWGMADNTALWDSTQTGLLPASAVSDQTDVFALSIGYEEGRAHGEDRNGKGAFGLAAKNAHGTWVNAVDLNVGGTKHFVQGPWKASYPLGTYGVDTKTRTAWAVLNHNGDFVATRGMTHGQAHGHGHKAHR